MDNASTFNTFVVVFWAMQYICLTTPIQGALSSILAQISNRSFSFRWQPSKISATSPLRTLSISPMNETMRAQGRSICLIHGRQGISSCTCPRAAYIFKMYCLQVVVSSSGDARSPYQNPEAYFVFTTYMVNGNFLCGVLPHLL